MTLNNMGTQMQLFLGCDGVSRLPWIFAESLHVASLGQLKQNQSDLVTRTTPDTKIESFRSIC